MNYFFNNQSHQKLLFFCFAYYVFSLGWANLGLKSDVGFLVLSTSISFLLLYFSKRGENYFYVKAYLYFNICLWVFNSFIRRYADVSHGWSDLNIYSLAPVFSTIVAIFFIQPPSKNLRKAFLIVSAMIFGLIYSLLIGIYKNGLFASFYAFLTWLAPLFIFLYIVGLYKHYDVLIKDLHSLIVILVIICGFYGIYQYFFLPDWDAFWIINVPMTSVGLPSPMQFRSFSFLNSPMIYAPILAMFMAFILIKNNRFNGLALIVGCFSLLITFVRAAWVGYFLFLLVYFFWLIRWKPLVVIKLLIFSFISLIIITYLLAGTEVGYEIYGRIESLFLLEEDTSFDERGHFYESMLLSSLTNIIGDGMGGVGAAQSLVAGPNADTVFDSGILQLFVLLGWLGVLFYVYGLIALTIISLKQVMNNNKVLSVLSVLFLTMLLQLVFANRLIGPIGFFLFLFLGCLMSGIIAQRKR